MPAYSIRAATPADADAIADVESRAAAAFAAVGIDLGTLDVPDELEVPGVWTCAHVATVEDAIVGFARLTEITPELLCLDQVSVLPDHGRMGVGRGLLQHAVAAARVAGYRRLTGTTFRDVEFNGPLYRNMGTVEDTAPHPQMLARRRVEQAVGLDRFGERVVMSLDL